MVRRSQITDIGMLSPRGHFPRREIPDVLLRWKLANAGIRRRLRGFGNRHRHLPRQSKQGQGQRDPHPSRGTHRPRPQLGHPRTRRENVVQRLSLVERRPQQTPDVHGLHRLEKQRTRHPEPRSRLENGGFARGGRVIMRQGRPAAAAHMPSGLRSSP